MSGVEPETPQPHVKQTSGRIATAVAQAEKLNGYRAVAVVLFLFSLAYELTRTATESGGYAFEGTLADTILRNLQLPSVFFVLTGFLVFLPVVRASLEPQNDASPWYAFVHRLLLILPQYFLAVIAVWMWRFDSTFDHWYDPLRHLTLTHVFSRDYLFWPIGPSWIVATELWFCILLALVGPALVHLCRRLSFANSRSLLVAISLSFLLIGVVYKGWAYFIAEISRDNYLVYLNPIASLDSLAIGMLLAIIFVNARYTSLFGRGLSVFLRTISLVGVAALFSLRWFNPTVDLFFHTLFAVAFAMLLAATVLGPQSSWLGSIIRWRPLQYLAAISSTILLVQEPLLTEMAAQQFLISPGGEQLLTNVLVVLVLSVLIGTIIYWLFVYPALQASYLFTPGSNRASRYPSEGLGEQAYAAPSVEEPVPATVPDTPLVLEDVTPAVPPSAETTPPMR